MTMINIPAQPEIGPDGLPTPTVPDTDNSPAQPGEGPEGLPTPSLPGSGSSGTIPGAATTGTAAKRGKKTSGMVLVTIAL